MEFVYQEWIPNIQVDTEECEGCAQLTAEVERLRKREADNILLAWGGVCPSGWAITGDPSHMAEIIRQRGDELQTENLRVKAEVERLNRVVEPLLEKHESEDHYLNGGGDEYKRGWYSAMKNVRERLAQLKGADRG